MAKTRHEPLALRCPSCKYDVSQTLRDGITTCPECGWGIDITNCRPRRRPWPVVRNLLVIAVWLIAPWLFVAIGIATPSNAGGYTLYGHGPILMQIVGLIQLLSCLVAPLGVFTTIFWIVNYWIISEDRGRSLGQTVLYGCLWLAVPTAMLAAGILL